MINLISMTCIVGLIDRGVVWMGGDAAGSADDLIEIREERKVFRNGEILFGFAGSFRIGQLLRCSYKAPLHPNNMSADLYISTLLVDSIRDCLKKNGANHREHEIDNMEDDSVVLVGYRHTLYHIEQDYHVSKVTRGFHSIGTGGLPALGSLYTSMGKKWSARKRILIALESAQEFSTSVREPFTIVREVIHRRRKRGKK